MKDLKDIQSESDVKVKEEMDNEVIDFNEITDIQIESREFKSPKTKTYCILCQEYGHVINDDCVVNSTCLSCGVKGHVRRDCYCLLCQEYGHVLNDDCTTCFSCGRKGHVRRDCPPPLDKNNQMADTRQQQLSSLQTQELNPEFENPDDENMESHEHNPEFEIPDDQNMEFSVSQNSINIQPKNENINHLIDLLKGQPIHYNLLNHFARSENQRQRLKIKDKPVIGNNACSSVIIYLKDQRHFLSRKIDIGKIDIFPLKIAVPILLATGDGDEGGHYILFKSELTKDKIYTAIVDTLPVDDNSKVLYEILARALRNQLLDLAGKFDLKLSLGEHEIDTSFQQQNMADNGIYALIGARNVVRAGTIKWRDSTGKRHKIKTKTKWIMGHDTTTIRLRIAEQLIAKGLVNDAVEGEKELLEEEIEKCKARLSLYHKMRRKHLSVRRRTNISQRTPKDVTDKVTRFILYVKRMFVLNKYKPENVFAMDETAVWYDSVGNTTVEPTDGKTVQLKSTGHKKANITVALTASMDGTKKKPFIVIKGKGREKETAEAKKAKERTDCIVEFSDKGWINEKLTLSYQSKIHPTTSFHSRLNIWDAYRCHTDPSVKAAHKKSRIDMAVIPGGCTSVIHAPAVSWNKPFKARLTEEFDNFMESGDKTYNEAGNVRSMSMKQICDAVVKCWDEISPEIIRKSFEACGQVPNVEASKINCFKEGEICHDGLERLEMLLGLDINKVDMANLCELPEGRIQQVDNIMDEHVGDGIAELIENELVLDEDDDEDDGLVVDVMGPNEDLGRIEEEGDSGDQIEGNSFFQRSSLLSIKRGTVQNNNRKRPYDFVESSPSLKSGPSSKR